MERGLLQSFSFMMRTAYADGKLLGAKTIPCDVGSTLGICFVEVSHGEHTLVTKLLSLWVCVFEGENTL